jgi:biopolymer transport protein ExbD
MSMSHRARRMLQHQMRHRADAELNLIPMIDILSVMVSFLLVYSTNVEVLQNTKAIEIPQSIAEQPPRQTVVVMLTRDELFVQGEPIATVAEIRATDGDLIGPLRDALKRPTLVGQQITEKDLAEREITVMGDKALPYDVLKKVMRTCTDADYGRISLAVLQKDKPVPPGALRTS